jgi:hypothetical protein
VSSGYSSDHALTMRRDGATQQCPRWSPCTARHALCNAHALRELQAVTDAAQPGQWCWAAQAADALRDMKRLADAWPAAGGPLIDAYMAAVAGDPRWAAGKHVLAGALSRMAAQRRFQADPGWVATLSGLAGHQDDFLKLGSRFLITARQLSRFEALLTDGKMPGKTWLMPRRGSVTGKPATVGEEEVSPWDSIRTITTGDLVMDSRIRQAVLDIAQQLRQHKQSHKDQKSD